MRILEHVSFFVWRIGTHQWWIISQNSSPTIKNIKSRKHTTLYDIYIYYISLSFHLFLHSFTLRLVDLSPCRPLEIILGRMDLQGPGPYRIRKIVHSAWPGLSILQQSSRTVESDHPKNNPVWPAGPTLLRAAWDHPSLCERVPNLDSRGSC